MCSFIVADMESVRSEYEVSGSTFKALSAKYGISIYHIKKSFKSDDWERFDHLPVPSEIRNSGLLTSIGIRKFAEILQSIGDRYDSSMSTLVSLLAIAYQKWLSLELEMAKTTNSHKYETLRGTEALSADFIAMDKIKKEIVTYSDKLGISVVTKHRMGLRPKLDTDTPNLLDILDDVDTGL